MDASKLLWLIPVLPLLGAAVNGAVGRRLPTLVSGLIGCAGPAASLVLSILAFQAVAGGTGNLSWDLYSWFSAGDLRVSFGLAVDPLSAVMLLVVTGVGTLIHVYSIGYMKEDPGFARFFAYLNLFMFSMLTLVLADNLVLMFLGWEGVGLCSYLLIGFWYEDLKNADAGKKAFIVNRVGDFGFLLGIFLLFGLGNSVAFGPLQQALKGVDPFLLALPALLLFLGACGKSAQIPLYVWLPDAMAGPTPVSALIHAATMVTAGVYMVGRLHFVFAAAPGVMETIVLVGAATALLAGVIAVAQNDIKKILAYSTVSQLGFMFAGMASSQFSTGMFHVVTHAFFKALLFLGAGAVIHALHGEQDIRKMGGLAKKLPVLAVLFIIGGMALAGLPGLSGYISKDAILAAVWGQSVFPKFGMAWGMLVATALLTAFYTTRLLVVVFLAPPAVEQGEHHELHKPGLLMIVPLVILALLSLVGGALLEHPFGHFLDRVWTPGGAPVLSSEQQAELHHAHVLNQRVSMAVFLAGFLAAFVLYGMKREWLKAMVAGPLRPIHALVENKFYVDEIYQATVVSGLKMGSALLWFLVDRLLIDTLLVNGVGQAVYRTGGVLRRLHTGSIAAGAGLTVAGVALILRFGDVRIALMRCWTWLAG